MHESLVGNATRHLLTSSNSNLATYIALAIIVGGLGVLSLACCIFYGCCVLSRKQNKVPTDAEQDADLTTVPTISDSQDTVHSLRSTATARMERALASERLCPTDSHSSDTFEQLPAAASAGLATTLDGALRQSGMPLHASAPIALARRPSTGSSTLPTVLPPWPHRRLHGAVRRPGGLPTIPSVTSMGSAAKSDMSLTSECAAMLITKLTDPSQSGSHFGVFERANSEYDADTGRTTPAEPSSFSVVGMSPPASDLAASELAVIQSGSLEGDAEHAAQSGSNKENRISMDMLLNPVADVDGALAAPTAARHMFMPPPPAHKG